MAEKIMNEPQQATSFKQSLGLLDGTMIVAGSMIGSGIFIVSADITRNVGSAGWLIAVWLITGFMTITAAVSYGELSGMFPKAGGQYVYLKEAYNPFVAFLYGWSFFAVIQTATIAAVGVAFSKFAGYFIPALELKDENILARIGSFKIISCTIGFHCPYHFSHMGEYKGDQERKTYSNNFHISQITFFIRPDCIWFLDRIEIRNLACELAKCMGHERNFGRW